MELKQDNIKPIIGSVITTDEGTLSLLALNNKGYIELLQILSDINSKKNNLIISIEQLSKFDFNIGYCIVLIIVSCITILFNNILYI